MPNDTLSAWDVLKPSADKIQGLNRLFKGVDLLALSRFKDNVTIATLIGDLVRDQGMRHIAFVDRLGDTFRWKGENVATTQLENAQCASANRRVGGLRHLRVIC